MNKEQNEILNDLINYYDAPEDETLGDTLVIPQVKSTLEPPAESFEETLVMNTAPIISSAATAPEMTNTTVIDTVFEQETEFPQDEILGNLDINGNTIVREKEKPIEKIIEPPVQQQRSYLHVAPTRKVGIWHSLKPLWATLIVCIMLAFSYLFYVTDTGVIGIYKSNFAYNFSLIMRVFGIDFDMKTNLPVIGENDTFFLSALADGEGEVYEPIKKKKATIPFDEAGTACFEQYKSGVVCAKSNYICYITKNGKKKWEQETQISKPLLSASGKYIAVAGKDNTYLNLYKGKKLIYSVQTSEKIKDCSVSERGDVALVTEKKAHKGGVLVFNKKGEEIFSWISGVNYITSVAMLKTRNVAVSLANAENSVNSFVMIFDVFNTDPINGTKISKSLVFDSVAHKNNIAVYADNAIASVTSDGELNYCVRFDKMNIAHISSDKSNWIAVSYTNEHLPYIDVYNKRGALYATAETESVPDNMDVYKSTILYNNGRDVICGTVDDSKSRYPAPMTVKNLILIDRRTYIVVYENSIEIIKR